MRSLIVEPLTKNEMIYLVSEALSQFRTSTLLSSGGADDVLAQDVLNVLHITPTLRISVLEPDESSSDVRRAVLDVVNDDRLFAPGRHEDLDGFVVIAVGALVERALNGSSPSSSQKGGHPAIAYHSKMREMIGADSGSGSMIFLPSAPTILRYPSGATVGQMPCSAFSCIPFRASSDRLSM